MAIIGRRKKRIVLGKVICGVVLAIFLGIILIGVVSLIHNRKQYLSPTRPKEVQAEIIQLTKDAKAGDVIQERDICVRKVSVQGELPLRQLKTEYIGKRLRLSLSKKTILTKEMLYEGSEVSRDLRIHKYQCIELTDKMQKGNFVDIRISFANGTDFILLSKKRIEDIVFGSDGSGTMDSLWIEVTEEEILRMSSAVVDAYQNEGSRLYAIAYVLDTQESATVNYPVNEAVRQLIAEDPNIINRGEEALKSRLRDYIKSGKVEKEQKSDRIEEQEESEKRQEYITAPDNNKNKIEYFD